MNRSVLLALGAVVALAVVACSSNSNFLCAGECPATDGGTVSIDKNISSDNNADAVTACYQALSTLAGQTCTAQNSLCACATQ